MPLKTNIETLNNLGPGDQEIHRPTTVESNHLRIEDNQMKAMRGFASASRKVSPAVSEAVQSQQTSAGFQAFMHIKERIDRSGQSS